jgi:putative DNA primase/helicase
VPEAAYPAVCSKPGDPTQGGWYAMRADQATGKLPEGHNNYFNGSSFFQGAGPFSVRKTQSAACHALLLDDLGTKASMDRLGKFQLSWQLETSPGNFQGGIILKEPITDTSLADGLQKAIIKAGLSDEGTTGPASRWMRLPVGINGKPQYRDDSGQPFQCRLVEWNPDVRYTPQEIVEGLQLDFALTNHEIIADLLHKAKEDSAAVLEPEVVDALATMKQSNPAEYQRKRSDLKIANSKVPLMDLDRAVKSRIAELETAQTHHSYAKSLLAEFTESGWKPVGHQGALNVLNPDTWLWERKPVELLIRMVAEMHDGQENCERASDYRAIAEHAISLATDDTFFADAPNGLGCPGGFYQIKDHEIVVVPLMPEHRQRVMLGFTPKQMPTPLFDAFMHETFMSEHEGEEQQQSLLVQEMAGGIMLGVLYKFQIAILFYEPFGRAGKGTFEKQLRCLVPKDFVSAISPFKWHQDYHVATLAGKRLNVVGELPENEPIPAAAFKTVLGGDLITGRHPTHRPITFTNEASHLFMSNHLITTKDQSEAFFTRWKIVEFPNSRLRLGLPLDKDLAQRIIDNELPGIAYWALEGAARLLRNGKFTESAAHDRLMAKWRRTTNTLEEFIHEACVLFQDGTYRRSEFYVAYTDWCSENGRKPFSKGRVKELLEHNIGMGIRLVEVNGHETFRGLMPKSKSPKPSQDKAAPQVTSLDEDIDEVDL